MWTVIAIHLASTMSKADLPRVFVALEQHFLAHPDIAGAKLFAQAETLAIESGWLCWGGQMAG
jgi:hypothetical protein